MFNEDQHYLLNETSHDQVPLRITASKPTCFTRSVAIVILTEAPEPFWSTGKYRRERWVVAELLDEQANAIAPQTGGTIESEDGLRTDVVYFGTIDPNATLVGATFTIFFPHLGRRYIFKLLANRSSSTDQQGDWTEIH